MKFAFCPHLEKRSDADVLIFPFWEGPKEAALSSGIKFVTKDFTGKNGETALCYDGDERILLLGLGKKEDATVEALRRAYASAVRLAIALLP